MLFFENIHPMSPEKYDITREYIGKFNFISFIPNQPVGENWNKRIK